MLERPVLLVANRGPVDGEHLAGGAGGLVSALSPLLSQEASAPLRWLHAANIAAEHQSGRHSLTVQVPEAVFRQAYDQIANGTLWFMHHHIIPSMSDPAFDAAWWEAWHGYRRYNEIFAEAICDLARPEEVVFIQDYHLHLAVGMVKARRPELKVLHFCHTPFAAPAFFALLPPRAARELAISLSSADRVGFHTLRWEQCFARSISSFGVEAPTFVEPLGPSQHLLRAAAESERAAEARAAVLEKASGRAVLLRVDRLDPAKNVVRSLLAFREMLRQQVELANRVFFVLLLNVSRESTPWYQGYRDRVLQLAGEIEDEFGSSKPLWLLIQDDFRFSVGAMQVADVLVANSVRDGLNLVVKEALLVSERGIYPVLSSEVGVCEELRGLVEPVHPMDVTELAAKLRAAVAMPEVERRKASRVMRERIAGRDGVTWLQAVLRQVP